MRFIFLVAKFPPLIYAGAEMYVFSLCKALQAKGHLCTVLVNQRVSGRIQMAEMDGIRIVYDVNGREIPKRIDEWHPDVVCGQWRTEKDAIVNAKRIGATSVLIIHSTDGWHNFSSTCNDRPDMVVFNSKTLQRQCGYTKPNGFVIHPIIDVDRVGSGSNSTGKHIALVNMSNAKGADVFYGLARKYPALSFMGITGGYGNQVVSGELKNVRIVSNSDNIGNLLKDVSILLMPSKSESFGMIGVEAQYNGIPVIATDLPNMHESLGDGALFARRKTDNFAISLDLLQDKAVYTSISDKAKANAARFGEKQADYFVDISKMAVSNSAKRTPTTPQICTTIAQPTTPKKKQLLSVIISAYKARKWLRQAVDSVLCQELPDNWRMEVLIASDGCKESLAVAKNIHDMRVGVVEIKENVGTYVAANTLIAHSKGDAIFRMDADDFLMQTALLKMLTILDDSIDVGVVGTWHSKVDENLKHIDSIRCAPQGVRVFRRSVMDRLGGYRPWSCAADDEINRRYSAVGIKSAIVGECLYLYRQHESQLTKTEKWSCIASERSLKRDGYYRQTNAWEKQWDSGEELPPKIVAECAKNINISGKLLSRDITACMAAIPSREASLPQVVKSLIDQVDRLCVYLNGFDHVPECLNHSKITYVTSSDYGDMGDAGKFFWIDACEGYYLTCDDDIVYPPDYVDTIVSGIKKYRHRAVVGFHASVFKDNFENFIKSRVSYKFGEENPSDVGVHVLGTGVCGFHSSTMDIKRHQFRHPNMADTWLAEQGQVQQVPFICLAHDAKWLRDLQHYETSIYNHSHKGIEGSRLNTNLIQTDVVKANWPWKVYAV